MVSQVLLFLITSITLPGLVSSYGPASHQGVIAFDFRPPFFKYGSTNASELQSYSVMDLTRHVFGRIDWREKFMKMLRMLVDDIVDIIFDLIFSETENSDSSSRRIGRRNDKHRQFLNECSFFRCFLGQYLKRYEKMIRRLNIPNVLIRRFQTTGCSCL